MSHTTHIKAVPITDINALRQSVERMNNRGVKCTLVENSKPRMYYPHQEVKCDFVLRLENAKYDVGFQKQADGSYAPIYDEWAGIVGKELTVKAAACPIPKTTEEKALAQIGVFTQEYARCSAVNAAAQAGYYVETEALDNQGNYQMQFASYS